MRHRIVNRPCVISTISAIETINPRAIWQSGKVKSSYTVCIYIYI